MKSRKYELSTLPEEAKKMLSLDEKVLFDQQFDTLSPEDQKLFRNARAKISKFMNADKPKKSKLTFKRLNYHFLPACIWSCMDKTLNKASGFSFSEITTPPRSIPEKHLREQRHAHCELLRKIIRQFFYHQEPFQLDFVTESTWAKLEETFPCSRDLIMMLPSQLKNFNQRNKRRKAMEMLNELFKLQPRTVVVMNMRVHGCYVSKSLSYCCCSGSNQFSVTGHFNSVYPARNFLLKKCTTNCKTKALVLRVIKVSYTANFWM